MDSYQTRTAAREESPLFEPLYVPPVDRSEASSAADPDSDPNSSTNDEQDNPALSETIQRRNDWRSFDSSLDQEAYRVQTRKFSCFPATAVSSQKLAAIINILENVDNSRAADLDHKKKTFQKLHDWIFWVLVRNVRQTDLDSSGILPRIAQFIDQQQIKNNKRRGMRDWFHEELTYIYRKWSKGDLSCDPNRGLIETRLHDKNGIAYRTTYELDKDYEHYVNASEFGENNLVNGQRWYSREQMMRDGAHNAKVGGIAGTASKGAYSIVVGLQDRSHGYADVDRQYTIQYEGTTLQKAEGSNTETKDKKTKKGKKPPSDIIKPTSATQRLLTSEQNGKSVRVIRTFQLPRDEASNAGKLYRYDGLYTVVDARCTNANIQAYTFTLRRNTGQGELRGARHILSMRSQNGNSSGM